MARQMSDSDMKMAAEKIYNDLIDKITNSKLNFQMQLSPFSACISLKKSLQKDRAGTYVAPSFLEKVDENDKLLVRIKNLEGELINTKEELRLAQQQLSVKSENDMIFRDIFLIKAENDILKKENDDLSETLKSYGSVAPSNINQNVPNKLFDDIEDVSLNACAQNASNFIGVHKAPENLIKKKDETKVEVEFEAKCLKKNVKFTTDCKSSTHPHISQPVGLDQALSSSVCSICSRVISNHSPQYFHGYKLRPACNTCTKKDHLKDHEPPPFSAFLGCEMPSSLVAHWLSPHKLSTSPSISSSVSLRSHCVKWPSSGERLYTPDDILQELMNMMKKSKWWK